MMDEIYSRMAEMFDEGRPCVLATIVRLSGSGPRGVGTKLLVMEDGSFAGTIGGGLLEAQVLKGAKEVLATMLPCRKGFFLRGTDVAQTEMICGGDVEVFLEPILTENIENFKIFQRIDEIQKQGGAALLLTSLTQESWQGGQVPKMLLEKDGQRMGSIPGFGQIEPALKTSLEEFLRKRQAFIVEGRDREGRSVEFFVEPVITRPFLYVFGGGHVSSQIVPLAALVGFKVVVIDDRPEFAEPSKFPDAEKVLSMPFEGALGRLPVNGSAYLVIVTRGHIHDKTVLEQCLRTEARYIGMIGSRRKKALIYERLFQEGFTPSDLNRVHAPIGLSIGAETPEEIAVSIVAELIKVRAGLESEKQG